MVKYLKPIKSKIVEIKKAPSNGIFLVGEEGSGKTTTLLEYIKQSKNTNNPVIDITPISLFYFDVYQDFAKLFQICSIIQKILLHIKNIDLENYKKYFIFFNVKITNIQRDIVSMYSLGKYDIDNTCIDIAILNNPEILLNEFFNKIVNYLDYHNITVILDNFDVEKPYTYLYQTYIYEVLKKYFKVVATISDEKVINNQEHLNTLAQNNSLIMMDFNRDVNIIKNILNNSIVSFQDKNVILKKISFIFSDNSISELIKKTNGSIFKMIIIIRAFLEQIEEINYTQYNECLLKIADDYLEYNKIFQEKQKTRKLYLK